MPCHPTASVLLLLLLLLLVLVLILEQDRSCGAFYSWHCVPATFAWGTAHGS
jgi:hypothetical protein